MPRRPRTRVNGACPKCNIKPSSAPGDDVKLLNSSELHRLNKLRSKEGQPLINIRKIIRVFADYLAKNNTDLKKFGYANPSQWVNAMLKDVECDRDNTWVFAVEGGQAVAYASGEVMSHDARASRHAKDPKDRLFLYIANVCSVKPGCGSEAMRKLIEQQISKMRRSGVKGDITVVLNFTPDKDFLLPYYSKMGFRVLSKHSSPKEHHCAMAVSDPVHSVVMCKTCPGA